MARIVKVTSKGTFSPALTRQGIPYSQLGKVIDGVLWKHPRLRVNRISGSNVRVTNPAASMESSRNGRTASLGMGGVGQRGRTRDVGATAVGET